MESTDKDKPIPTTPDGVWEAKPAKQSFKNPGSLTTDLQNNGYPSDFEPPWKDMPGGD